MSEVCAPVALSCVLTAAHTTAASEPTEMPRAQQASSQSTHRSVGPMLEQQIWVQHILLVVESQERFSGLGFFVFYYV